MVSFYIDCLYFVLCVQHVEMFLDQRLKCLTDRLSKVLSKSDNNEKKIVIATSNPQDIDQIMQVGVQIICACIILSF